MKVFVEPEVLPSYPIHMYVNKKLLGKTNVTNENTVISRGKLEKHREYINMSLSNLLIVYIVVFYYVSFYVASISRCKL